MKIFNKTEIPTRFRIQLVDIIQVTEFVKIPVSVLESSNDRIPNSRNDFSKRPLLLVVYTVVHHPRKCQPSDDLLRAQVPRYTFYNFTNFRIGNTKRASQRNSLCTLLSFWKIRRNKEFIGYSRTNSHQRRIRKPRNNFSP